VDSENPVYASVDGVLFDKTVQTSITCPAGKNAQTYTLPSSVTTIEGSAFADCASLTNITIPSSATAIEDWAFGSCVSLTSITVDSRNPAYVSKDGVLFDKTMLTIIKYPVGKKAKTYTIPSLVKSIGDRTFVGCTSLTSVAIPSLVASIGDFAFYECSGLTSITIPSSVTSIGFAAFGECDNLTSVTLSRRTQLGKDTFPPSTRIIYSD
jgi:hypothetical protein